ncbi:MAG: hypothetical protein V4650_08980 [Pseudomonadota bacterium]
MRLLKTPVLLAAACCVIAAVASSHTNARIEQRQRHLALKGPESPQALMQAKTIREAKVGKVPAGALRAAIEQKARIAGKAIAGAAGEWTEYGRGNLDDASGAFQAARVDTFSYDEDNKRLFISVGTGGVWMSEAVGGVVSTIGDEWTSVGDNLPSQIIGAVAYSRANGGTLIAAGGEGVMGSSGYLGLGAYWTDDLGATWTRSNGFPDESLAFRVAVDMSNESIVYIASNKGLFRSTDAGKNFSNVNLPTTPDCAGEEDLSTKCLYTNFVTDVVVKIPGGSTNATCPAEGCAVLAAVGFRTGRTALFQDGSPQAPGNGLYRSDTGLADSFAFLDVGALDTNLPNGFATDNRVGRVEFGQAFGPEQDHDYVYAMVQDAVLFNGGGPGAEGLDVLLGQLPVGIPTVFNGLYVSADFGGSWTRMADTQEVINNTSGSEIAAIGGALGSGAGIQAWYNQWVAVDPTRALMGIPTRMAFGLEEVWQNRTPSTAAAGVPLNGIAQSAPAGDFEVIGVYFNIAGQFTSSTHADQQGGIYVPTEDGGVCLFAGNDGGVYKQCVAADGLMNNNGWGEGANNGMYTMLPYGLGVAKDGTVYFGNQDNGSGLVDPARELRLFQTNGGDGFYADVDPDNSDVAYYETQNGGLVRTTNRGGSNTSIAPTYTRVMFDNWFRMDPTNAQHMVTGAQEIYETDNAQTVTAGSWVEVFNLGTNPDTGAVRTTTTMEVQGSAVYVGGCGDCGASGNDTGFASVLATNVMDGVERVAETNAGWHLAAKRGLPSRYITSIAIDPVDPKIVYVAVGGYLSNLRAAGSYLDPNAAAAAQPGAVFKSVNAGDDFTNVTGDLPVAQVASVVLKGTQLLVGTDIGVFISEDTTGASWTTLGTGLPNVPVNMIRLKPKATADEPDMLFAATFGRSIWNYEFKSGSVVTPPVVTPPVVTPPGVPPVITPAPVTTPGASPGGGRFGGGSFGGSALLGLMALAALRRRRV